jgi:glucosamine--fructose-6-phosphate aminotransferase (isomerizing)
MCGIFGLAIQKRSSFSKESFQALLEKLYLLSESRGKESAGLHLYLPGIALAWTIKGAKPASELIRSDEFKGIMSLALSHAYVTDESTPAQDIVAIAHSRLVTNGKAELSQNNQPVRSGHVTVIHNGIIVNVDKLWRENPLLQRFAEVDTEILSALIAREMDSAPNPARATQRAFSSIQGAASIAWVDSRASQLVLATNTGDLYRASVAAESGVVFASEYYILEQALGSVSLARITSHVEPGSGVLITLGEEDHPSVEVFSLRLIEDADARSVRFRSSATSQHEVVPDAVQAPTVLTRSDNVSLLRYNENSIRALKRCSTCVLPETFPFIRFDAGGVCNYCHGYQTKYRDYDRSAATGKFDSFLQRFRRSDGKTDVLVPFSGGRDSCYGLHLIKNEFGLNPITFTYDWGMVTDLARRNIARLCGSLGVQNILVSADIKKKRENIRMNVSAWLKRPDLGMVPLFMAGDKHFHQILNTLKKQTGINLNIWSANPLENTDFKVGLCGIEPSFDKQRVDHLPTFHKLRLLSYYARGFLTNPGLLNSSLLDSASAFMSFYFEPRVDYVSLFHHIEWQETEVNRLLLRDYDFEMATDSPSTWRIGDGTAPFYNYIYVTSNGFSEFDTFRSNQIREGQISRDEALSCILIENRPRVDGLRWYLDAIGLGFDEVIKSINKLDRKGLHL